jgi:hypothetical protein
MMKSFTLSFMPESLGKEAFSCSLSFSRESICRSRNEGKQVETLGPQAATALVQCCTRMIAWEMTG